MKKIDLYKGNKCYSIIVDRVKYLCGPNYELKFKLMNILRQSLTKTETSEYQIETNCEPKVLIDDAPIKRNTVLFEVNQYFELSNELKMQAKSLIGKYYETQLNQSGYFDTIYTIDTLLKSFSEQINENIKLLHAHFLDMTTKQLTKLLVPEILIDEYYANMYDLSYEDLIIFQLELISYVVNCNPTQNYIVIIDIPVITKKIKEHLINSENTISFILLNNVTNIGKIDDYYICYSTCVDMADEEYIYENIVERLPIYLDLQEVYRLMELIIYNKSNERTKHIIDLIK